MHSPTDLTDFLSCSYLSGLERAAAQKILKKPHFNDPTIELLRIQGEAHESEYLDALKKKGLRVVEITSRSASDTVDAMKAGADVIYQGVLTDGTWRGYADFLIKANTPSALGNFSYNVEDTKLSSEVKGTAVLQLCIYAEQVERVQGRLPDEIAVICGNNERHSFNPSDFTAYLQYVKNQYERNIKIDIQKLLKPFPEPVDFCHTCTWHGHCKTRWQEADHLKLVAGITKLQRKQLRQRQIDTLTNLASQPQPPQLERTSAESAERIFKQAQIQLKGREQKLKLFEFLPVMPQQGLAGLPEPCQGDIWFDIEGDSFIGKLGLEYLFGWVFLQNGEPKFHGEWAYNNLQEQQALKLFLEFTLRQRKKFSAMHVYHFGHYEPTVIRRLSTRYNLLVDEVDDLLRNEVFINLHRVVKNGLRLSVEGYGLKEIEAHYDFHRKTNLQDAGNARKKITLLLDMRMQMNEGLKKIVQDYNEEDCLSTFHLHRWLEQRRDELLQQGTEVQRFVVAPEPPPENEKLQELALLSEQLLQKLPQDFEKNGIKLNETQQAIKNLSDLLMWYRREDKSYWWDFFRMKDLTRDELFDERKGIAGPFTNFKEVRKEKQSKVFQWNFPPQIFDGGYDLNFCGKDNGFKGFKAEEIDSENGILILKRAKNADEFASKISETKGLFFAKTIRSEEQIERFKDFAGWVLKNDFAAEGEFSPARNLLLKKQLLKSENGSLRKKDENIVDAAIRLCSKLEDGVILPIQGPPGTGKTYTAAHMICHLIKSGKKVGVTAQSHAVIYNLLCKFKEENDLHYQLDVKPVKGLHTDETADSLPSWLLGMKNSDIAKKANSPLIGGTVWLWAKTEMKNKIDVLFIDEAGQFSLADAIAASHCASAIVLLGDPQQLENVTQGVHPPEVEKSVLGYWLGEKKVLDEQHGLFLDKTWRMAPSINEFISKTFYEEKLETADGLENQKIHGNGILSGAGLRFIPCAHEGNQSSSVEEIELIKKLLQPLLKNGMWVNKKGNALKLTPDDILIVAPYNAQVSALRAALPQFDIGTVDKFQGRQAPLVIYSMATSSPAEAPRGMEFLYSQNRLNVAVSRAQCLALLVASAALFEFMCKTPRQMQLANAYCRFLDMAEKIYVP